MTERVYTIAKALFLLGGRAHSSKIADKCLELDEQNHQNDLSATVRDALQRYSSMSAKGTRKGIMLGTTLDVFHSEPENRNSIFWLSGADNPIIKFVTGELEGDQLKDILRGSIDDSSNLKKLIIAIDEERTLFVREHWRSPPDDADIPDHDILELELARFKPIGAWCTRTSLEVELMSNVVIQVPLWWFPSLLNANQMERSNLEFSPFGIHWPDIDEDISVIGLLRADKAPGAKLPGGTEA